MCRGLGCVCLQVLRRDLAYKLWYLHLPFTKRMKVSVGRVLGRLG